MKLENLPVLRRLSGAAVLLLLATFALVNMAKADDYLSPWRDKSRAIILDAYEKNPIEWPELSKNKQIAGFIGKASDGLPPSWSCRKRNKTKHMLCKKTYQNYWLKKQLYKTRRLVAKSLGLMWGAYHLGRPGNPIDQANHFVDFTEPDEDDLLALDIEHDDPEKWISLTDAEAFVKHVKFRTGRYPVLYTNHNTAKRIAARRAELPVLSRLPLWYARYKPDIRGVFPMGHWESYSLWQFSARPNCSKKRCLYRVAGTKPDIDVNVAGMKIAELKRAWPFGELLPERESPEEEATETLMVSNEKVKKPEPPKVLRFKTNIKIENHGGKKITLASIAIPSPRMPAATELGFHVAVNTAVLDEDDTQAPSADVETEIFVSSITPIKNRNRSTYGYSNKVSLAEYTSPKNERYLQY